MEMDRSDHESDRRRDDPEFPEQAAAVEPAEGNGKATGSRGFGQAALGPFDQFARRFDSRQRGQRVEPFLCLVPGDAADGALVAMLADDCRIGIAQQAVQAGVDLLEHMVVGLQHDRILGSRYLRREARPWNMCERTVDSSHSRMPAISL